MFVPPASGAGTQTVAEAVCAERSLMRPALATQLYAVLSTGAHELTDVP